MDPGFQTVKREFLEPNTCSQAIFTHIRDGASNSGFCSWFEFARAIFKTAGLEQVKARPISTPELNRPAPRSAYSLLDNYCIRLQGMPALRPWEEALQEFLSEVLK